MNHYNNKSTLKLLTLNKKMNQSYESSDMVAWREVGSLRRENEKLKEENETLMKEENEKLKEENETLRKFFGVEGLEEENEKLKEDMKTLEYNRMGLIEAWHKYTACGPDTREDCLTDLEVEVDRISEWEEGRAFVASRDGLEHPWEEENKRLKEDMNATYNPPKNCGINKHGQYYVQEWNGETWRTYHP